MLANGPNYPNYDYHYTGPEIGPNNIPFFSIGLAVAGMVSSFSLTVSRNASCCMLWGEVR